jgi:hypothetical protein
LSGGRVELVFGVACARHVALVVEHERNIENDQIFRRSNKCTGPFAEESESANQESLFQMVAQLKVEYHAEDGGGSEWVTLDGHPHR